MFTQILARLYIQDLAKKSSALEPPIWCGMLLANSLRSFGANVEIIDCEVNDLGPRNICTDQIYKSKPKNTMFCCIWTATFGIIAEYVWRQ